MPADAIDPDLKQTNRVARLDTPLGTDKLVLVRFDGDEGMSELFEYRVDALSLERDIDFDKLIGRNCCVTFNTRGGTKRHFNGVLVEAQWVGVQQAAYAYRLVLRPWLWLLGRRADCRIVAHKKTVIQIIEKVFRDAGFNDFEVKATGDYPAIPYCVQYRETDLAFVSRLMEEWGLYTFFEHGQDKHTLVLADSPSCHKPVPCGTVPFIPIAGHDRREIAHVHHWLSERRFRTGKMSTNDFDYMKPNTDLKADRQASERYALSRLEAYDYPGRYDEQDVGGRRAKVRLEAEQALDHRRHAAGDAVDLHPGSLFQLAQHPTDDAQYLVVRATHSYVADERYRSGGPGAGSGEIYHGHYEVLRSSRPFRAPLLTPKPVLHGPQTAFVVTRDGKKGPSEGAKEEIDVDEEGRIFLRFHWNKDRAVVSRPVRVAQMWSGKGWGWQVIPRVGQEVVVEFLEGDPDQPLCVGTVFNQDYAFPYKLPDEKTKSGMKSDSSKGHNGYNELFFEDKKGEEKVSVRAEKDMAVEVRNAEIRTIGTVFKPPLGSASRSTTLKNGDEALEVSKGNWKVKVGNDIEIEATMNIHIKAGATLTLEVPGSKIVMGPAGVAITGKPLITLN